MIHVVAIDRKIQEDLMAWQAVARALSGPSRAAGTVLVHSPGERVDRLLEGAGMELRGADGLLRSVDPESADALDQAMRGESRRVAGLLGDDGVPAVGFMGGDRGLLGSGAPPAWLARVALTGSVPVLVSAISRDDGVLELPLDESLAWLCGLPDSVPVLLTRSKPPGISRSSHPDHPLAAGLERRGVNLLFSTLSDLGLLVRGSR